MRIRELDGVRGIAILLVLTVHLAQIQGLPSHEVPTLLDIFNSIVHLGWTGVDVFFCLSGYLITSILIRSRRDPLYFRIFYTNRLLRIFPLYYAFLAVAMFALLPRFWQAAAYWLYAANILNATGNAIPVLNHFWSLSIEEQFYLLWPLIVRRFSPRQLSRLCMVAVVLIEAARCVALRFSLPSPEFIYTLTPLRCDGLLLGALVAALQETGQLRRYAAHLKWAALAGASLVAYGIFRSGGGTGYIAPPMERFGYLGVDLLCANLVGAIVAGCRVPLLAVFRSRFLTFFGKYSYAIYIFHLPIRNLVGMLPLPANPLLQSAQSFILGTALSTGAALVSWRLIEAPCLALKDRLRDRRLSMVDAPPTAAPVPAKALVARGGQ